MTVLIYSVTVFAILCTIEGSTYTLHSVCQSVCLSVCLGLVTMKGKAVGSSYFVRRFSMATEIRNVTLSSRGQSYQASQVTKYRHKVQTQNAPWMAHAMYQSIWDWLVWILNDSQHKTTQETQRRMIANFRLLTRPFHLIHLITYTIPWFCFTCFQRNYQQWNTVSGVEWTSSVRTVGCPCWRQRSAELCSESSLRQSGGCNEVDGLGGSSVTGPRRSRCIILTRSGQPGWLGWLQVKLMCIAPFVHNELQIFTFNYYKLRSGNTLHIAVFVAGICVHRAWCRRRFRVRVVQSVPGERRRAAVVRRLCSPSRHCAGDGRGRGRRRQSDARERRYLYVSRRALRLPAAATRHDVRLSWVSLTVARLHKLVFGSCVPVITCITSTFWAFDIIVVVLLVL